MQTTDEGTKSSTDSATGAVLLLLMMPVVAASVVLSVQLYLGGGLNLPAVLLVASLALLIYAANGLSDPRCSTPGISFFWLQLPWVTRSRSGWWSRS